MSSQTQSWIGFIITALCVGLSPAACKSGKTDRSAKVKALSSTDGGDTTDRVYAAYRLTGTEGDSGLDEADAGLYFVGCKGEDKNAAAASATGKPLNERNDLEDFRAELDAGRCEILVGDDKESRILGADELRSNNYKGADRWALQSQVFSTVASCLGFSSASLVASSALMGSLSKEKRFISGFGGTPRYTGRNWGSTLAGVISGVLFCGPGSKNLFDRFASFHKDESQKLFFEFLARVDDGAMGKMRANAADFGAYQQALRKNLVNEASSVYLVKYFVPEFNKFQEGLFEQNKGVEIQGKKVAKAGTFFDALKKIDTRRDSFAASGRSGAVSAPTGAESPAQAL